MARGNSTRAPSQNAYKGSVGHTQTETVHVTSARGDLIAATVYTTIDALTDPELAERLYAESLNTMHVDGAEAIHVDVPLVYHDPAAEVLALVLGEAQRHRELDERIRLLERLRDDRAAVPVYAKDFAVVFGGLGLRKYLEQRAQQVLTQRESTKEQDRKRAEIVAREAELQRAKQQIGQQQSEIDRSRTELERSRNEVERSRAELERSRSELERNRSELDRSKAELERMRAEARARVIAVAQASEPATTISLAPPGLRDDHVTNQVSKQELDDVETVLQPASSQSKRPGSDFEHESSTRFDGEPAATAKPHRQGTNGTPARPSSASFDDNEQTGDNTRLPGALARDDEDDDDEVTGSTPIPTGSDPLTTETFETPFDKADKWVDSASKLSASTFAAREAGVRLALIASERQARGLTGDLDVRVLLRRVATYPVVVVLIGPPAALRSPSPKQRIAIPLDVGADLDRAVLVALANKFELTVDVTVRGQVTRRVRLSAPLAENIAYILRAADDHLRGITADGEVEPSYRHALDLVLGPGHDVLGDDDAEAAEFRDDKLATLDTAQHLRRAIAIARRFARPSREDYLICTRGYPLQRWRELRRHVLERAVAWGIWMGPELAQIAVSEGLARSRRDLIAKIDAGFEALRHDPDAFDIDADAAEDNAKAIAEEARQLGIELRRGKINGAIKSEDVSTVSGSIDRPSTHNQPKGRSTDELIELLDDKHQRVSAATELCERAEARAAGPVIAAVKKMSRAEAVRVLGRSVKFGAAAAPPLMEGLASSKAYLRHGCALALALLRTEEGTHAVIEQLINEPTEIWREIARALGQVGPSALMPLASYVGRLGDRMTPALQERVAWAMAHVGVRGGRAALDQIAAGQSVMAPIARHAIGLHSNAARDEVRVRPGPQAGKDVTVNRAFSRRFFEALEADRPDDAQAALQDLEASGPHEVLDEADLIEDVDDDEAELDESDLIQT